MLSSDRPADGPPSLDRGSTLFLYLLRVIVTEQDGENRCAHGLCLRGADGAGLARSIGALARALDRGCRKRIRLHAPASLSASQDEIALVQMISALQRQESSLASHTCKWLVRPPHQTALIETGLVAAECLAFEGILLRLPLPLSPMSRNVPAADHTTAPGTGRLTLIAR